MKIWMRLGITLDVPDEQGKKILSGDEKALLSTIYNPNLANGKWDVDGDSYVPTSGNVPLDLFEDTEFDLTSLNANNKHYLAKTVSDGFLTEIRRYQRAQAVCINCPHENGECYVFAQKGECPAYNIYKEMLGDDGRY